MTPEQHANTVREALRHLRFSNGQPSLSRAWDANDARAALAALVALAERADTLERELVRITELNQGLTRDFNAMLVEQSKQRNLAEQARAEADRLQTKLDRLANVDSTWNLLLEADRLREALRQLGDRDNWSMSNEDAERYGFESGPWYFDGDGLGIEPWEVVRAALADPQTEEQT